MAVHHVADQGVPHRRELNADLVPAAGHQVNLEQRAVLEALHDTIRTGGRTASFDARHRLHLEALGMLGKVVLEPAVSGRHLPFAHGEIDTLGPSGGEQRSKLCKGAVGAGEGHEPRGVTIDAMDRSDFGVAEAPATIVVRQPFEERTVAMGRRRDGEDPRLLVHHDQLVILVYDAVAVVLRGSARSVIPGVRVVIDFDSVPEVESLVRT